jgi:hypothetical protein
MSVGIDFAPTAVRYAPGALTMGATREVAEVYNVILMNAVNGII